MNKYILIAVNDQGASVRFYGVSKAECRRKFLSEFYAKGWQVTIEKLDD